MADEKTPDQQDGSREAEEKQAPDPNPDSATAPESAPAEPKDGIDPEKKSELLEDKVVLVVEDSSPMRRHLKKVLTHLANMTVLEAEDGLDGLRVLREKKEAKHTDLIFLDLMMPNMDGAHFLEHLRADRDLKDIPVLMVTTRSDKQDIMRCARFGISGYIIKPYTTAKILTEVRKVFGGPLPFMYRKEPKAEGGGEHAEAEIRRHLLKRVSAGFAAALRESMKCEECSNSGTENCPTARAVRTFLLDLQKELDADSPAS
jgi:two-component system, chemotaxis family, chemotaxis protein CheY